MMMRPTEARPRAPDIGLDDDDAGDQVTDAPVAKTAPKHFEVAGDANVTTPEARSKRPVANDEDEEIDQLPVAKLVDMLMINYRLSCGDVTLAKEIIERFDAENGTHTTKIAREGRPGSDNEWVVHQRDEELARKRAREDVELDVIVKAQKRRDEEQVKKMARINATAEYEAKLAFMNAEGERKTAEHEREIACEMAKMAKLDAEREREMAKLDAEREREMAKLDAEREREMAKLDAEREREMAKREWEIAEHKCKMAKLDAKIECCKRAARAQDGV
ncbi:hypothetical protein CYMTET_22216 [Cymbomonas tetramitiformis]|uniref:Uncharacterized protein n=1 Tax=Cymbomonas tetramitiformis TaxID=36881 RepID=A0AAE0G0N1_9CHLO|nr:hypothetical protein CYMTET_22216 [Cymbomonas tetramitiformis]